MSRPALLSAAAAGGQEQLPTLMTSKPALPPTKGIDVGEGDEVWGLVSQADSLRVDLLVSLSTGSALLCCLDEGHGPLS